MGEGFVSRGFFGRRRQPELAGRIPPGQYLVDDWPVLSAGPTPRVRLDQWRFTIEGLVRQPVSWSWDEFLKLPSKTYVVDISCVTKWTKLDMKWQGGRVDTLFQAASLDPRAAFITACSFGDYSSNLAIPDLINDPAFLAHQVYEKALTPDDEGS